MTLKNFRLEKIHLAGKGKPDFNLKTDDIEGILIRRLTNYLHEKVKPLLLRSWITSNWFEIFNEVIEQLGVIPLEKSVTSED